MKKFDLILRMALLGLWVHGLERCRGLAAPAPMPPLGGSEIAHGMRTNGARRMRPANTALRDVSRGLAGAATRGRRRPVGSPRRYSSWFLLGWFGCPDGRSRGGPPSSARGRHFHLRRWTYG